MRRSRAGLSLVETALTISIAGSLLAIFVPTFYRNLRTSKSAEAVSNLAALHAATATYFASVQRDGVPARHWCLPDEAGPTPPHPTATRIAFDFQADDTEGAPTWKALDFAPDAVRYRYSFIPETTGCGIRRAVGTTAVTLRAEGDLDQDGVMSCFERQASIDEEGRLEPRGALIVIMPVE